MLPEASTDRRWRMAGNAMADMLTKRWGVWIDWNNMWHVLTIIENTLDARVIEVSDEMLTACGDATWAWRLVWYWMALGMCLARSFGRGQRQAQHRLLCEARCERKANPFSELGDTCRLHRHLNRMIAIGWAVDAGWPSSERVPIRQFLWQRQHGS